MTDADRNRAAVLTDVDDGVLTITLNRPERRNALSPAMIAGLSDVLADVERRDDVGAIVLTGAGGSFCAGGDVIGFDEAGGEGGGADQVDPAAVAQQLEEQRATVGQLHRLPIPVIAALPGAAAGAGLGLALASDLRIGCPKTLMVTAFVGVGLSGDYGVAWLLERTIGPARSRELMLLNSRVDAAQCLAWGLVNRVVPVDELSESAHDIARSLADGPRLATAHIKRNLAEAPALSLDESMSREVGRHKECGLTADHIRAVRAFAEKRTPTFGGR